MELKFDKGLFDASKDNATAFLNAATNELVNGNFDGCAFALRDAKDYIEIMHSETWHDGISDDDCKQYIRLDAQLEALEETLRAFIRVNN